jgi:hypothetical protein
MTDYERVSLMLLSSLVARGISKSGAEIRDAERMAVDAVMQAAQLIAADREQSTSTN